MRRRRTKSRRLHVAEWMLGFVLLLGVGVYTSIAVADEGPSIAAGQPEYAPGDTVTLSGSGWAADETVHVVVDDDQGDAWSHEADLTASADGSISGSFTLPAAAGTYTVTATGDSGAANASFTVTAPPPADPPPPPAPCIPTGNETLSAGASTYAAGQVAQLSGTGFSSGCIVGIRITLPDGSVFTDDDNSGADGGLAFSYRLPDDPAVPGTYTVEVLGDADTVLASATFEGTEATPEGNPTLNANKDDYAPGETVTLTGVGWQAGEAVHIVVDDDEAQTWKHEGDVTADDQGEFTYQLQLPDTFVAAYKATATGPSGTAIATFTDSIAFGGCPAGSPISVTTTADENGANAAACSLREAITAANGDTTADTITLPAGTYTLSASLPDLDVTNPLTINGAGLGSTIIDGGNDDRVFDVFSNGSLTLNNMTVQNGNDTAGGVTGGGGAIRNQSRTVTLANVRVFSNTTTEDGGGIWSNGGTLSLTDVTVDGNETTGNNDHGGGLYITGGTATLLRTVIEDNSAGNGSGDDSNGGGLYISGGTVTLTEAIVDSNTAYEDDGNGNGGGLYVAGGSVAVQGSATAASTITNNTAERAGGGIYFNGGTSLTLTDVTVSGNEAASDDGGGIYNDDDDLTVNRVTISGNDADDDGGGIYFNDNASLTNVTVSGNSAGDDGGGMRINNSGNTATLTNVTITLNTGDQGDGIDDDDGTIALRNTIVAANGNENCGGDPSNVANNLDSGTTCSFNSANGSQSNAAANLGPLQNNGGLTSTHALLAGSAAINTASGTYAPAVDQRGVSRPQGAADDIGAYEFAAAANTQPTADAQSPTFLEDSANNAITLTGDAEDAGQTLTFYVDSLPANGTLSETSGGASVTVDTALADAELFFTPNANYCTTDNSFDFYVKDNSGAGNDTSANATVSITVTCVNDPPSFTGGGNVTVLEDSGGYSAGWASAISPGPGNESGQSVSFVVSNNNNGLFSAQPAISAAGTLTFTPAANANGSTTVDVYAQDDGGTADGGDDTSATVQFTITVTPVNDEPAGTDKTVTMLEDGTHTFAASDFGFTDPSDSPANNFNRVKITSLETDGDLELNSVDVTVGQFIAVASIPNLTFKPDLNENGTPYASFTFQVEDDGGIANGGVNLDQSANTFTFNVTAVNDAPVFGAFPANAGGQYSDPVDADTTTAGVQALTLSATDVESAGSALDFDVDAGECTGGEALPDDLVITDNDDGTATISGRFDVVPATYTPCIVVDDGEDATAAKLTLTVTREDATIIDIAPSDALYPNSGVALTATFVEDADGWPSTSLAVLNTSAAAYGATTVAFSLNGFGGGNTGACADNDGVASLGCQTGALNADAYEITATIGGPWFTGGGVGTLAVIDPSNGFATGGGWFPWNNSWRALNAGKANFAFTGKLLKKNAQGGALLVIHTPVGPYVVKSNSFGGLTNGQSGGIWYTTMTGKATYGVPDGVVNPYCGTGITKCGNFQFLVYAQDKGEPGAGMDTYRMKLIAPNNATVFDMPAPPAAQVISGGNVQVPHR